MEVFALRWGAAMNCLISVTVPGAEAARRAAAHRAWLTSGQGCNGWPTALT